VLAGVRDVAAGEAIAREAPSGRLIPVELDVTDAAQVAAAAASVGGSAAASVPGGLDALVNNAGIGVPGPMELVSGEDLRRQFEVNVFAQVAVTQAMLPALRIARGRIVLMSSIGGRVAMPFTAPYAASKHAIEAIGDALRMELARSHIQVALVEPGSVATPIWGKNQADAEGMSIPAGLRAEYGRVPEALAGAISKTGRRGVPPEQVAERIERALTARRMRARYLIGRDAAAMLAGRRLLPTRVFDRIALRAIGG
jgi:NAD(P)-dependent dehydrogenase (short-subunit alcohol dehydrogenase family)